MSDISETRKAYEAARAARRKLTRLTADIRFEEAADAHVAALEADNAALRAALGGLITQVEQNCLDTLAEAAQHYTAMGHPHLDRQDAAIYAEVQAAVKAAAAALAAGTQEGDG